MFDGNMFLPDTGTPIWKMERSRTRLAVWLPEPLTVATWMLKSLTTRVATECEAVSWTATSLEDMELLPRRGGWNCGGETDNICISEIIAAVSLAAYAPQRTP